MKRLKILIILFFMALAVPLAYFVLRSFTSLEQEEVAEFTYFAETLFDQMETELDSFVSREESRAVDEYNYYVSEPRGDIMTGGKPRNPSPLSKLPQESFILGYFQNGTDGSFQTPLVNNQGKTPENIRLVAAHLSRINKTFNTKLFITSEKKPEAPVTVAQKEQKKEAGLAEKYFAPSQTLKQRGFLGRQEKRLEEITIAQARNIAKEKIDKIMSPAQEIQAEAEADHSMSDSFAGSSKNDTERSSLFRSAPGPAEQKHSEGIRSRPASAAAPHIPQPASPGKYKVEIAPLQSVAIDDLHVFIFRRIVLNNQIYRQGFVLKVNEFLKHLGEKFFIGQPLSHFSNLQFYLSSQEGTDTPAFSAGAGSIHPEFTLNRTFPRPFSFINASLACDHIPRSAGRNTLVIMTAVVAGVILLGLFAIYHSVRVVVDLSERRAGFVSSVTHELKTPLTNIRMYMEMLEQGIASNKERESEYFRIVNSESSRLSRLINNVLEFAKLEKKQRRFDMKPGSFSDVIEEVKTIMAAKLRQEDFTLNAHLHENLKFTYDREVMVQVLINLIENSMKFGKNASNKEIIVAIGKDDNAVTINVIDSGPGIPEQALQKIFDDFYRVDDSLTRNTKGTGIGLALVKKFIAAMGGKVSAANNHGPGCTITISLPT